MLNHVLIQPNSYFTFLLQLGIECRLWQSLFPWCYNWTVCLLGDRRQCVLFGNVWFYWWWFPWGMFIMYFHAMKSNKEFCVKQHVHWTKFVVFVKQCIYLLNLSLTFFEADPILELNHLPKKYWKPYTILYVHV